MKPYRNEKLLKLAKEAPHCMATGCFEHNYGQVVACHSNSIQDGKGMGTKAHDVVAFGCKSCHDFWDGRDNSDATPEQRRLDYYHAVYNTWVWLMQTGHLQVK